MRMFKHALKYLNIMKLKHFILCDTVIRLYEQVKLLGAG